MKNIISIFIFTVLLFGCSESKKVKEPVNLIGKEIFTDIIYDVSLLEGHMASYNLNQDIFKDSSRRMYKGIFDKYKITAVDFKENNDYYILTDQYREMSKNVLKKIEAEELKYKDVKPFNTISFVQFSQLFEKDSFMEFFQNDTTYSNNQKLDSALIFYRINSDKLKQAEIDSIDFELNIKNIRRSNQLFHNMFGKKEIKKELPANLRKVNV